MESTVEDVVLSAKNALAADVRSRRGRIVITEDAIFEEAMSLVFAAFIPIRCQHRWESRDFEYFGFSRQFDALPVGETTPDYLAIVHSEVDEISGRPVVRSVSFQRVK